MLRLRFLVLLAAVAIPPLVHAQTGPSGGPGPVNPTSVGTNPGATQPLASDRLAAYLRSRGHRVEQGRFPDGAINQIVYVQKDGWDFVVHIEYALDQRSYLLTLPVGSPTAQMSADQLVALLKANFRIHPNHFSIREVNSKLQLYVDGPFYSTNTTEADFQSKLDWIIKAARDTHPQWDSSRWPLAGQVPAPSPAGGVNLPGNPAKPAAPVNSTPVVAPPVAAPAAPPAPAPGLANTTWVGSEEGFGRLEFRFQPTGQVTMIDTTGSHPGTYSLQGNAVTLTFFNGEVVYNGTLNGQAITGSAHNTKKTWSFSVRR
jgi:hypothetical protein